MEKHKTHLRYQKTDANRRPAEVLIARLLREAFSESSQNVIVAVGGPGGTGKSTFSRELAGLLGDAAILSLDDYKTSRAERRERGILGSHPEANRISLIRQHLDTARKGDAFQKPIYNNETGDIDRTEPFTPNRFIVADGEISTYPHFRSSVDLAIFIDSDWRTQLATRVSRDINDRGYTREKAITTFLQSNLRDFTLFGAENKKNADIHLFCREDYSLVVESIEEELFRRFESLLNEDLAAVALSGCICAVTTPFDRNDRLDTESFIRHLDFLSDKGISRILINGTTGEFHSLSGHERKLLLKVARRYFPGMVLFQAGCDGLGETLEEVRWGEEYGADAIVVITPYYYAGVSPDGIVQYYTEIARHTTLPLIVYHFPRHTQISLSAEALRRIPHAAIKDSAANLELVPATPAYFIGGDRKILQCYEKGGSGFVTGIANVFPEPYLEIERAASNRENRYANELQQYISELSALFTGITQPAKIKEAVAARLLGYPTRVRPPHTGPSSDERDRIRAFVADYSPGTFQSGVA